MEANPSVAIWESPLLSILQLGEIGVPGDWCIECGSGGGSNNGAGEGSNGSSDVSSVDARVDGHDMPDVVAADTGGGAAGNGGGETGVTSSQGDSSDLSVLPDNAKFAQKTYSSQFSSGGTFNGRLVSEIAQDLANGTLQPEDIPVQYVNRGDSTFLLNTRSTVALIVAGVDRSTWIAENVTGNALFENLLNDQLGRNNLTDGGVDSLTGPLGKITLP